MRVLPALGQHVLTLLAALDALAAPRGDGLRPEFRALLARHDALRAANVEPLSDRAGLCHVQSGPHPAGSCRDALPDGVTPLRRPALRLSVPTARPAVLSNR